jgi:hypothetical protein
MKRFAVVLCVVALMMAISMPVYAADVKFGGEYYAAGYLERNRALSDPQVANQGFYAQRLRVDTTFKVAEGLSLVTRFDALERVWGKGRVGSVPGDTEDRSYATTDRLAENIEFMRAYVDAKVGPGSIRVGYHGTGTTGTAFTDNENSAGVIRYYYANGPWSGYVGFEKQQEKEWSGYALNTSQASSKSDNDADQWKIQAIYKWTTGDAGLGYTFYNDKTGQTTTGVPTTDNYYRRHRFVPFFRGTFGGLYLEAELNYYTGDQYAYNGNFTNVSLSGWSWYGKAQYTMGPVYVGGQYAYVAGDDGATKDKFEGGYKSGRDYKPCLIFLNSDYDRFAGGLGNGNLSYNSYTSQGADNFTLYQVFAGFKPSQKLELFASYSLAQLNQKTTWDGTVNATDGTLNAKTYVDDKIGSEFDITATYKIYDNLSYMVGAAYLWTGDYFKGAAGTNDVGNDYLLTNKLSLSF